MKINEIMDVLIDKFKCVFKSDSKLNQKIYFMEK